jgi:hypothetical protein
VVAVIAEVAQAHCAAVQFVAVLTRSREALDVGRLGGHGCEQSKVQCRREEEERLQPRTNWAEKNARFTGLALSSNERNKIM